MFETRLAFVNQIRALRFTAPRAVSRFLAATVFPPRCGLCAHPGSDLDLDLCGYCRESLPWDRVHTAGVFTALRFENPADELIRALKYRHQIANARLLGVLLAQAVLESGAMLPRQLIPVPLHPARLRERGFNQAAVIARYAGRLLGIPLAQNAVRRVRNTPSQTSLNVKARRHNLRGAFASAGVRGMRASRACGHVAIVDDVITTGSTVAELRGVLLGAGVSQVTVWAVARAK